MRETLGLAFPGFVAAGDRLMLTLHAYFNESGSHGGSECIVFAGYISTAEQWELFDREWSSALGEWGLHFFHMTDFANHAGPYRAWTEDERRHRFSRLSAIIKRHTLVSVALGFLRSDYNAVFDKETNRFVGGPFGALASMCFVDTAAQIGPLYPSAKIAYVFEAGGPAHGRYSAIST